MKVSSELENNGNNKRSKRTLILIIASLILLIGLGVGLFIVTQQEPQDIVRQAQEQPTPTSGPVCPTDGATCQWDAAVSATSYEFVIVDVTTGQTVKSGVTDQTTVSFTPVANHTYRCNVTPKNDCGTGPVGTGENTCSVEVTPTFTPTPTGELTPTPTGTLTPTPTGELTPTPTGTLTPTETPTPTPTEEVGETPTPTEIVVAQQEETPTPTTQAEAPTEAPTIPPAGSQTGITFIAIAAFILVTLLLVF